MALTELVSTVQDFVIQAEQAGDQLARDDLLDRAMEPGWKRKSSQRLRSGRLPSAGLALVARDEAGQVIGSVRLWDIRICDVALLLLGPLAVEPACAGAGIGSALMREAISLAGRFGHGAIILVGDAAYYQRFGFSADKTGGVIMPGPVERERLLGLELISGYLDDMSGMMIAAGRLEPFVAQAESAFASRDADDFCQVA